jgi:ribonuclease VapC
MTVIDSSAIIAVLRQEPDADAYLDAIDTAAVLRMSAANHLEAAIVIDSARNPVASRRYDEFITQAGIQIEAVTPSQARTARDAYRDYGKGTGHKASLNVGDCLAYALAHETGEPLLFKGDDFPETDITPPSRPQGNPQPGHRPLLSEPESPDCRGVLRQTS